MLPKNVTGGKFDFYYGVSPSDHSDPLFSAARLDTDFKT
ncbi:hypothetical protein GLIP_0075 [Aliiglaciecola lipolytica E3]|uniref:Uncharacterized protein n=1 Tax=Aliiglaciecola lipolytica E3 TaxID=1127673 RepID=K6YN10_9ALTE|nr:hypothetical protein GLIP_0075 [Aliiglaciecola lipolytica E3]